MLRGNGSDPDEEHFEHVDVTAPCHGHLLFELQYSIINNLLIGRQPPIRLAIQ